MADNGAKSLKIKVYGLLKHVNFQIAKCCAQDLNSQNPDRFPDPVIEGMLEFDWDLFIEAEKKRLRGETWQFNDNAIVFINDECCGSSQQFVKRAEDEFCYENFRPLALLQSLADEAYTEHLNAQNHKYVYMDITIGEKEAGKLLIELFSTEVPKTCANFRSLCTGEKGESPQTEYTLHYKDSLIHRIVKNGWIQGGDIWMKRGDGGESIYGPVFEDENFSIPHDRRGIVGMANKGRHTNGSQFYITLQPTKWMDKKYVAFGKVIEGTDTLKAIEAAETMNERPMKEINVANCGTTKFVF